MRIEEVDMMTALALVGEKQVVIGEILTDETPVGRLKGRKFFVLDEGEVKVPAFVASRTKGSKPFAKCGAEDRKRVLEFLQAGGHRADAAKELGLTADAAASIITDLQYAGEIETSKKDMGKVHALLNAGWTQTKVAQEFGVAPSTLTGWIRKEEAEKAREEYTDGKAGSD